ncbi:hypothetical protein JKP88DRAFT_241278 [Tribonema minus]|uniref:Treble clef zinc finger domain-containing protein n=1 Tax=Tribonema minus TaxID=303371 RepID=A0A835YWK7_9STRA|nr:hypothetical protein JKP88DRAFT_241278 [Tribonema minus]
MLSLMRVKKARRGGGTCSFRRGVCGTLDCANCFSRSFAAFEDASKVACWMTERNNGLHPSQVCLGTDTRCWFKCDGVCSGHTFQTQLKNITGRDRTWCPYCAVPTQRLCDDPDCGHCLGRSFAGFEDSGKVECWSKERNGGLTPRDVSMGCNKEIWFCCKQCGHDFQSNLNSITGLCRTWCTYCAGKALCSDSNCQHCFQRSFAAFEDVGKVECWVKEGNNGLTPRDVAMACNTKFWFCCDQCNHDFQQCPCDVTKVKGTWCPYCGGKALCDNPGCQYCFQRSFAAFKDNGKVECWSTEQNGGLTPRNVTMASNKKIWFQCSQCAHPFETSLKCVTRTNASWCPYCAVPTQRLCDDPDCGHCLGRSFAGFDDALKVACWSAERNGSITPRQVAMRSGSGFWFVCDGGCNHAFWATLVNITGPARQWCPYCAVPSHILCQNSDCQHCFHRSFASFEDARKVACWSMESNKLTPRQVFIRSDAKYTFVCDGPCNGHSFDASLYNIAGEGRKWCPYCSRNRVCGKESCEWCGAACTMCVLDCDPRRGVHNTKDGPMCAAHFIRSPHCTLQQRAKISLEIHFIASMEVMCSDRPGGSTWAQPTSWDCAVLPGLSYKPDLIWAFDTHGNVLQMASSRKIDLGIVTRVIILEVLEVGIRQHSRARTVSDERRESEIRMTLLSVPVDFVYVVVAAYNHKGAHAEDRFFARGCATDPVPGKEYEYHIVPERQSAWRTRVSMVVESLDRAYTAATGTTIWIGH